ncbi:hypothetical protein J4732_13635 [Serratia marcescens]|uniref:Uncharacterized protein n=1 Tax=Serratia marcescens TaxID=615 RepID=A0A939SVB9_SERMA|nr:hypothetical protein [Serratia marcescens]
MIKNLLLGGIARIFIAGQEGRIRKYWSLLVVISFILYDELLMGELPELAVIGMFYCRCLWVLAVNQPTDAKESGLRIERGFLLSFS